MHERSAWLQSPKVHWAGQPANGRSSAAGSATELATIVVARDEVRRGLARADAAGVGCMQSHSAVRMLAAPVYLQQRPIL
jgi:hypothetical protein